MHTSSSKKEKLYEDLLNCYELFSPKDRHKLANKPLLWEHINYAIAIDQTKIHTYNKLIDLLYSDDVKIPGLYSFKTFSKKLNQFMIDIVLNKKTINNDTIDDFKKTLLDLTGITIIDSVAMPISGTYLSSSKSITYGPFTIFKYPESKPFDESILAFNHAGMYISISNLKYIDGILANEQAKIKFDDFKHIIHYMIGHKTEDYNINIGTYENNDYKNGYIFRNHGGGFFINNNAVISFSLKNDISKFIQLDDSYFKCNETGNKTAWSLYTDFHNGRASEFQNRIMRSIIYAGKSILSLDINDSFINLIVAYEILLSYDEKSLFSKSIGQNIAETFALILHTDIEKRTQTFRDIKLFYRIRSALVHSAKKKPSLLQYHEALHYFKRLIQIILLDPNLLSLKNIIDFNNHINMLRFS